jgi:mannitol/fructose-specific phosphotransferase system IIA component (Ntr-type)
MGLTVSDSRIAVTPEAVLLNVEAATFEGALQSFNPAVLSCGMISEAAKFLEEVRLRERSLSTVTPEGAAFPHARTACASGLFLAIGRSPRGIEFVPGSALVHLIFLIGAPPQAIGEYLTCVAWLARRVREVETRHTLMAAESVDVFLSALAGPRS